jgi:hypothetical protein
MKIEKEPYGSIPKDEEFSRIYDVFHEDDEAEEELARTIFP